MMTISKPTKPYVVLESLANRAEPNKEERCLHMISAKENTPIRIGRGHQCEIRITDISVSRSHAQIVFQENKFYIKDQKSKFGTLIKFREPSFTLSRENKFKIQLGRFLYELEVCNGAE
jgi:predicted component of type VI protein secretion system